MQAANRQANEIGTGQYDRQGDRGKHDLSEMATPQEFGAQRAAHDATLRGENLVSCDAVRDGKAVVTTCTRGTG